MSTRLAVVASASAALMSLILLFLARRVPAPQYVDEAWDEGDDGLPPDPYIGQILNWSDIPLR